MGPIARVKLINVAALRNIGIIDRDHHRGDESSDSDDSDEPQVQPQVQAQGQDDQLSPALLARFSALELEAQESRDIQLQSLHQMRYQSEMQYDYYRHQGMQAHVPPHLFMAPEQEPPVQGATPRDGGYHSLFAQRMDIPPLPHRGGYTSYPDDFGRPTFTYPQFGSYQGSGSAGGSGWGLQSEPPQFGEYQGGTPSVFSHPDDMEE